MENKHNNHGFGNGFILGLLIGIIATLLVTTKKGRELFKEFTEKGLDKFSDLEKKLQEVPLSDTSPSDEFDDEDDYVKPEPVRKIQQVAKPVQSNNGNEPTNKPPRAHRFFKSKKN